MARKTVTMVVAPEIWEEVKLRVLKLDLSVDDILADVLSIDRPQPKPARKSKWKRLGKPLPDDF